MKGLILMNMQNVQSGIKHIVVEGRRLYKYTEEALMIYECDKNLNSDEMYAKIKNGEYGCFIERIEYDNKYFETLKEQNIVQKTKNLIKVHRTQSQKNDLFIMLIEGLALAGLRYGEHYDKNELVWSLEQMDLVGFTIADMVEFQIGKWNDC